ncbi:MAG TPA: DinB family protein, partial [Candidatus Binatia bacterium]|nr:DinB family protein [Candidatus Binatia bacterium]
MRIREYATAMAAYNQWMNEKLYATAGELTDAERKRDLGAFFKSIHGTLNHILLGDLWWMQRFHGEPLEKKRLGDELYADFGALSAARR